METLIHADMFFFIASIGFVLFFTLLAIALFYLIRLLKNVNSMATKVEQNIETISDEAKDMVLDFRDSPVMKLLFGRKRRVASKTREK
jgi:hypothetical protein